MMEQSNEHNVMPEENEEHFIREMIRNHFGDVAAASTLTQIKTG